MYYYLGGNNNLNIACIYSVYFPALCLNQLTSSFYLFFNMLMTSLDVLTNSYFFYHSLFDDVSFLEHVVYLSNQKSLWVIGASLQYIVYRRSKNANNGVKHYDLNIANTAQLRGKRVALACI